MLSQNALVKIQRHISIWQCTCTAEARSVRSDIYLRSTRLHSLSIHKGSSDTFKLAPSVSIRNKTTTRLENLMLMVQKRCSSTRGAQPKSSVTLGVDQKMDRPNLLPRRKHISLLLSYIWPKEHPEIRARVTFALFLMVTTKVVTVVVPFFFKAIVDSFDPATAITVFNPLALSLPSLAISYGLIRIFKHTIEQLRYAIYNDVAQKAIDQVSILVFRTLHQADAEYHVMRQTGGLSRQIERGLKGLNSVLTIFLFHLVPTVLEMALVCSVLQVTLGVTYSVTTFISVLAYCTFTLVTTAWRTKFRVQMNALNTKSSNVMVDSLLNFESVRLNNNEYFEEQRYKNILDEHFERVSRVTWSLAFLNFGQGFIMSTAVALNTWMAIDGVSSGALTIGDLVMMHSLMFQLSVPLNFFGSMYREITQASIDMQALFNIVESRTTLDNRATREFNFQRGKIEFRNVSFNYSNCAVDTSLTLPPGSLRDISLVIEPGQFIGLVGPTGSGKSTLLRLLCKLYTPSGGCILIDDQDITTVTPRSLRQHISVVTQDLSLFNESFRYNIAYGYPEATNDEIIQAAKMASIHDGIIKTEKGYDTIVGERGLRLSGGERQRVMIARALLRKSSILLADEATSALDNNTEAHVMKYLTKNKTSILVAHRLTSVIRAAQIVVVDQGRIREIGTHEELLRNRDLYWAMWQKQQNKSLESVPLP